MNRQGVDWQAHLQIMRLDYWIKNIFILPGIALGWLLVPGARAPDVGLRILLGFLATVLIASSNYVINELLDARTDRNHPQKRHRPFAARRISPTAGILQWLLLMVAGVGVGFLVSGHFVATMVVFWVAGCIYNIPPVRSKELPYVDVLSESVNNPIRLHAGWFMVTASTIPPLSLTLFYWMIGCYFMALKRYAEFAEFGDSATAAAYRSSFRYYTSSRLLTSAVFYVCASMLFFGAFSIRYKFELILAFPAISWAVSLYARIALCKESAASAPERLYREKLLMLAVALTTILIAVLTFLHLPWLERIFAMPEQFRA